jgi:hypothetical protein
LAVLGFWSLVHSPFVKPVAERLCQYRRRALVWRLEAMKHAGTAALDSLADLLEEIRGNAGLREPKRGTFYRRTSAFLHFHEDPAGLFADLKVGDTFQRFPVNTAAERRTLLRRIAQLTREGRRTS